MFIKLGVSAVPPATLVATRLVIGALILVAVVRAWGYIFPPLGRAWLPYIVLGVLGNCMPFWFITWGQKSIDSALAGILMAIMPLTTLVLAHFFVAGERMSRNRTAGLLSASWVIGLWGRPHWRAWADRRRNPGQLSVLAGALCSSATAC